MSEVTVAETQELGFLRLSQILGDRSRGIEPLIPVSPSTWWAGCKDGRFPRPIKLSPNVTVWRKSDVLDVIRRAGAGD